MQRGRHAWRGILAAGSLACLAAAEEAIPPAPTPAAQATANAPEDPAWTELVAATTVPAYPAAWQTNRPSPQAYAEYRVKLAALIAEAALKARDFYTRHPEHARTPEARLLEERLLVSAAQMGHAAASERLAELEAARLGQPALDEDRRFALKARAIGRQELEVVRDNAPPQSFEACLAAIRALQKEFPNRPEPWEMLLDLAARMDEPKARSLALEVAGSGARKEIKQQARDLLKGLDCQGKPLRLKFTGLDKREVDLEQWRGKVVLLVFWASWCGPYAAGVAEDVALYDRWHSRGLEVAAISFDKDKEAAARFVTDRQIPWPVACDGLGWRNPFVLDLGIRALPALWLIDKTGVVRDLRARPDVEKKIEKLLAETP